MMIDEKIKRKLVEVAEANSAASVQAEAAGDGIEVKGCFFNKPTMAHVWFFSRLKYLAAGFSSLADIGVCLVYSSSLDQKAVRNIAMPAVSDGSIVDKAYAFIIGAKITEDDVNNILERLWNPVLGKDDENEEKEPGEGEPPPKPPGSSPSGGAAS